jgi:hypothetical protein
VGKPSPADPIGLLRSILAHRSYVFEGMRVISAALERRANLHDLSKLRDDEFAGFSRINAAARVHKFGSPEYAEGMRKEAETIDLHFSRNPHHPEHSSMTFVDVIEMVVDWWAARKGYADSRAWQESFELNLQHKGKYLSPAQLWLAREVAALLSHEEKEPAA